MELRPLHDRLVVERSDEVERERNGIVIPDSAKETPQQGKVIALGKGKRAENGKLVAMDVKVGDRILFGKYGGTEIAVGGRDYLILREDEILAVFKKGENSKKAL